MKKNMSKNAYVEKSRKNNVYEQLFNKTMSKERNSNFKEIASFPTIVLTIPILFLNNVSIIKVKGVRR